MRFKKFSFDPKERQFEGTVNFAPDTVFGVQECMYKLEFSKDYRNIVSGKREYWYGRIVLKSFDIPNYILHEINPSWIS